VVDFGDVKAQRRRACKALNEMFLCPCKSDVLTIDTDAGGQVTILERQGGGVAAVTCEGTVTWAG
jgi:hypothetical protein